MQCFPKRKPNYYWSKLTKTVNSVSFSRRILLIFDDAKIFNTFKI